MSTEEPFDENLPDPLNDEEMDEARDFLEFDLEEIVGLNLFQSQELPEELHSNFSNSPFEKCIECERPLLNADESPYFIQKSCRDGETILEFAVCFECGQRNDAGISEDSKNALEAFFQKITVHQHGLYGCNFCGSERTDDTKEYEVFALAKGPMLVGPGHMICEDCSSKLESVLSVETRKSMDDFVGRNFPGVPEGLLLPVTVF